MEHIVRQSERAWLGWAALSLCLALAAAWLLVAYLTRPLGRLALAAREVARGERKTHLDERGPDEIAQVAAAFNHMAQALQTMEDDRAMSLAGISHDLRTPLTRLRLEIEMSALPEETREAMALEIGEMDTLIGQFIDFARGVDDEAWEELDLPQLVENVAQTFSRRGAKVAISHTPKRLAKPIIGKPLGLYRAISNLVTNALLYAGREKPIEIAVEDAGEHVIIHVLDRGPGLSALAAESVKRPFIRGQAARSDTGGAGLGLAIVERIARWHGGGLSLEPRDGGGLDAQLKLAKALPDIPR
jgi:two-component system osmolarity sensor histidine kinase EnvZ